MTYPLGSWVGRLALVTGLLITAPWVYAADGPGRIAVAGLYPIGYAGCLARCGLPRDLLYDAQLADADVLRGYDLLIIAGAPAKAELNEAIRRHAQGGGTVIVDFSATALPIPDLPDGRRLVGWADVSAARPAGFGVSGLALSRPEWVGEGATLAPDDGGAGWVSESCAGFVVDATGLTDPVVLARFPHSLVRAKDGKGYDPDGGPAGPAVVSGRLGQGRVILCGLQAGMGSSYAGIDFQALMLGLIKLATGGRAQGQLLPATPHVGYNQTLGAASRGAADEADDPQPDASVAAEAPAGPGTRTAPPAGFARLAEDPADEYDLRGALPPGEAEVLLAYWNAGNCLRLTARPTGLTVTRVSSGRSTVLDSAQASLAAGTRLVVKRRLDALLVSAGEAWLRVNLAGLHRGALACRGLVGEAAYQPTESAYFTDDFMRTDADAGPWETFGGRWTTVPVGKADMGANPFSYKCEVPDGPSAALAGSDQWDEYQLSCAVRPGAGGPAAAVGIGWYAANERSMYMLRAAVRVDGKPRADGFQLLRLGDGRVVVLAECAGGLASGQWCRLRVKASGPWIGAEVDGQRLMTVRDATYSHGRVSLLVDHTSARFDDVLVQSSLLPDMLGTRLDGHAPGSAGLIDVDSWAGPAMAWEPDPAVSGLFWRRHTLYGDTDLDFAWPSLPEGAEVSLAANADGRVLDSGALLTLRRAGAAGQLALTVEGRPVRNATVALDGAVRLSLRRRLEGANARLEAVLGGRTVASATLPAGRGGGRLAFRVRGFRPRISAFSLWSANLIDQAFDSAPCDWWVGSGQWDLTNRWSCVPEWSWFGGYGEGESAVWYKRPLVGDQEVHFYAGSKMLDDKTPGYRGPSVERTGDFNVTLCGDGRSADSGYAFVLGPAARGEHRDRHGRISGFGAQLRRRGQAVARNDSFSFFACAHNRWSDIRAEKHGAEVRLLVDGQVVLRWVDPEPLAAGYAALWTYDNGMLIPRVSLSAQGYGAELLSLRRSPGSVGVPDHQRAGSVVIAPAAGGEVAPPAEDVAGRVAGQLRLVAHGRALHVELVALHHDQAGLRPDTQAHALGVRWLGEDVASDHHVRRVAQVDIDRLEVAHLPLGRQDAAAAVGAVEQAVAHERLAHALQHEAGVAVGDVASGQVEGGLLPVGALAFEVDGHPALAADEVAVARDAVLGRRADAAVDEPVARVPHIAVGQQRRVAVFQQDGLGQCVDRRPLAIAAGDLHVLQPRIPGVAHHHAALEAALVEALPADQQVLGVELPRVLVAGVGRVEGQCRACRLGDRQQRQARDRDREAGDGRAHEAQPALRVGYQQFGGVFAGALDVQAVAVGVALRSEHDQRLQAVAPGRDDHMHLPLTTHGRPQGGKGRRGVLGAGRVGAEVGQRHGPGASRAEQCQEQQQGPETHGILRAELL
ncbi:MAG: hypothetical protein HZB16_15165 [Armatimonadetes bacterium]|nr:hypothetical protein [Armatimonadota bacterium]